MKKIIIAALAFFCVVQAHSQGADGGGAYAPHQGSHQANLLLGKGLFYESSSFLLISKNAQTVNVYRPSASLTINNPNANSIVNMVGVEYKYFLTNAISVSFVGAGSVNTTPWREAVDKVTVEGSSYPVLPKYETIDAEQHTRVVASLGAQHYFSVGNERLHPYAGAQLTFQYANLSAQSTYSGVENTQADERDAGVRVGQVTGWSPSLVGGVEYSLFPGLVVGVELKLASFYYSGVELFAQPGLDAMTAENRDFSFLAQPVFKIGFRF
ncbi:MAG: hypothetical protein LBO71_05525 [Prevotellaceae bacterium]|jgi:hypothetical protein|nr:hypothetical protein [Prevotellaceae bacterium]